MMALPLKVRSPRTGPFGASRGEETPICLIRGFFRDGLIGSLILGGLLQDADADRVRGSLIGLRYAAGP